MALVKDLIEQYCAAMFPNNVQEQDDLFDKIVNGEHLITLEEMSKVVSIHLSSVRPEFDMQKRMAEAQLEMERKKKVEMLEHLYNRLLNYKFNQAVEYLKYSDFSEQEQQLVKSLASMFGNSGWICGDFGVLVDASLRSLPGYVNYLKRLR